jgi:hypothetical protein
MFLAGHMALGFIGNAPAQKSRDATECRSPEHF